MVVDLEKYGVLGERLKKKFAKEVIDYYHKPKPKLTRFDALIQINKAHVVMLFERGIIGEKDGSEILKTLIELEENGEEKYDGLAFSSYKILLTAVMFG